MKVGEFKNITFQYGDAVAWFVTLDGDKFIDMNSAQVQNLQVTHLYFLEKARSIVLYVEKPTCVFETSIASEIAYRLHINAGELKQEWIDLFNDLWCAYLFALLQLRRSKESTLETIRKTLESTMAMIAETENKEMIDNVTNETNEAATDPE